ncbi:MAG: TAXI family TRAP transporter solute-binding subunit [Bacteroidetes bacterium]|nr:TAXI family TRAP transporter solute-binding subunit [Bacteroidota bacterium]
MITHSEKNWKLKNKFSVKPAGIKKQCVAIMLLMLMVALPSFSAAENLRLLRIGTGGKTGVYYPIGKIIAQGMTMDEPTEGKSVSGENGIPGYIGVAQNSAGSIENILKIATGEIEVGLVQADVAVSAFKAEGVFKGNDRASRIRAIASLYPEKFQIVVRSDKNILTFDDLRGKRISIDEIGSGTLAVMRIVLWAHGMTDNDLLPVYLKPVFTHDKIMSGDLHGFVMMGGAPMAAVSQLSKIGITFVPISSKAAAQIQEKYSYLVPGTIPAETYKDIPEITTIQVHAVLAVSDRMDEKLAYQLTAALWSQRTLSMLKTGHPQGKAITRKTALTSISIPLHPGAKKYYRENANLFPGLIPQ